MTLKTNFESAAKEVMTLSEKPSNESLLALYALYKQGTEGNVQGKRPGFTDIKGRKKFDAWTKLEGMTQDDAQQEYIDLVKNLASE